MEEGATAVATVEQLVEAAILCADRPVKAARIAEVVGAVSGDEVDADRVRSIVETLNAAYDTGARAFRVEEVASGYRMMTVPACAVVIEALKGSNDKVTLSRAAVESLAIIAYKQPVTRAELEAIRGVASGEILRSLIERKLVTITGRAEEPGRPMLYGTTKLFLTTFGLASLKDLPSVEELRARAAD